MKKDKDVILLTASSNTGVGLWTSICVSFARVFGVQSENFKRKQEKVIDNIRYDLERQMAQNPGYIYEDFRIVKDGSLAYTGTVIGVKDPNYVPPEKTEKISLNDLTDEQIAILRQELIASLQIGNRAEPVRPAEPVKEEVIEEAKEQEKEPEVVGIDYEAIADQGKDYFNVQHDYKKAFECFEKASVGSMRAKYNLAYLCYYKGYGVKKDEKKAVQLLKELVAAGYDKAADTLEKIKH